MKGPANRGNVWLRGLWARLPGRPLKARHVLLCAVQSCRSTPRTQQGRSRRGAQSAGCDLSRPENRQTVRGARRRLLRQTRRNAYRTPSRPSPRATGEAHQSATNQELCKLPIRASRSSRSPGVRTVLGNTGQGAWSVIPQILRGRCAASRSTLGRALYPRVRPAPRAQRIFETGAIASRLARVSSCTTMTTFGTKFPTPASMQM